MSGKTTWDLSWISSDATDSEVCPACGTEVEIKLDGKSSCPVCGHENIRPCNMCDGHNDALTKCDWSGDRGVAGSGGCTPFPKINKRIPTHA